LPIAVKRTADGKTSPGTNHSANARLAELAKMRERHNQLEEARHATIEVTIRAAS
jgi:hypothetical protein